MAKAMAKVSEIIAACLMMVLPALIGYWVDQQLSTSLLFTLTGLIVGMIGAFVQLKKLASQTQFQSGKRQARGESKDVRDDE